MVYGITSDTDFDRLVAKDEFSSLQELVRVQLYRMGKSTAEEIASVLRIDVERVSEALNSLKKQQEIRIDAQGFAQCDVCMIPVGAQVGWEAAVFDHFQALTKAVAHKLETLGAHSKTQDPIGGATLSFDINKNHPEAENVFGLLEKVRAAVNEVWERVTELEKSQPVPEDDKIKVTFYFGQNVEYLGLGQIADQELAEESQEQT